MTRFADPNIEAKYTSFAPAIRDKLLALREIAFATAETHKVGPLIESLKWGQPSFSTSTKSGSTFRLDETKNGKYALYFLCQTSLIETFRELYPDRFAFEGNRAIIFSLEKPYRQEDVAHCMALAMTYRNWSNGDTAVVRKPVF